MTGLPRVSVAIPLYNSRRHIGATLASVLRQSMPDFEVVVVDDGSTDGSGELVTAVGDPRIRLVRQPNGGVSRARSEALRQAKADLVAFLDSDDMWRPGHLAALLSLAERFPAAGLFGTAYREVGADWREDTVAEGPAPAPPDERILESYFATWASGPAPFHTSSSMARRKIALDLGGFKEGYSRGEDLEFFVRMALVAPVAVSSYVGAYYRRTSGGLTSRSLDRPDICTLTIEETLRTMDAADPRRRPLQEFRNKISISNALECLAAGNQLAARSFLSRSSQTIWQRRRWVAARVMASLPTGLAKKLFQVRTAAVRRRQTAGPHG